MWATPRQHLAQLGPNPTTTWPMLAYFWGDAGQLRPNLANIDQLRPNLVRPRPHLASPKESAAGVGLTELGFERTQEARSAGDHRVRLRRIKISAGAPSLRQLRALRGRSRPTWRATPLPTSSPLVRPPLRPWSSTGAGPPHAPHANTRAGSMNSPADTFLQGTLCGELPDDRTLLRPCHPPDPLAAESLWTHVWGSAASGTCGQCAPRSLEGRSSVRPNLCACVAQFVGRSDFGTDRLMGSRCRSVRARPDRPGTPQISPKSKTEPGRTKSDPHPKRERPRPALGDPIDLLKSSQ